MPKWRGKPPPRFDARWQRGRARRRTWRRWRWPLLFILIAVMSVGYRAWFVATDWQASDTRFTICGQASSANCVVDGDTIRIGERRIRLTGYDAPEMDGACLAERQLALVAQAELAEWLNAGPFQLDGGDDPPRDRYGRELRAARRGAEALSDVMLARGLAHQDRWNFASDWGRQGWC